MIKRTSRVSIGVAWGMVALTVALVGFACSGGTSDKDKTTTAAARAGATTVATSASNAGSAAPAASPSVSVATTVKVASGGALGRILTDDKGKTLYIFKNDVANSGTSAAESLSALWPPLEITSETPVAPADLVGDLGVITRTDRTKQVTYRGLPLYYYASDEAAGDTKGEGIGGVWSAARAVSRPD